MLRAIQELLYGRDPKPSLEGLHNGKAAYSPFNGSNPNQFRLGSATIGYRGLFAGWNSENIRHIGQNKVAHDFMLGGKSKHFIKMPDAPYQGFYYGNRLNNFNTTW